MEWVESWGVSLATFLPIVGAVVLLFIPNVNERMMLWVGTVCTFLAFVASVFVAADFDYGHSGKIQFDTNLEWIPQIDARYHIGLDGMSLPLFVLSTLVCFLCMIYLFWHVPEPGKPKALVSLILLLETGMKIGRASCRERV